MEYGPVSNVERFRLWFSNIWLPKKYALLRWQASREKQGDKERHPPVLFRSKTPPTNPTHCTSATLGGRARKTAPPSLTLPWGRGWGGELYPCVGDPVHDDDGVDAGVAGSPFFHENVGRVRGVVDGIPGGSIEWMGLRGTAGKVKTLGSSGRPNECRTNSANEQNYVTVQLGSFLFATTKMSAVCGESSIAYLVDESMNGWI